MQLLQSPKQTQTILNKLRQKGRTIGFVPTMGYLHKGHLSLVRLSQKQNNITVVSIFVNPLQFGPKEDLKKYPRDLKRDLKMLKNLRVDFVWIPTTAQMYPDGFKTTVTVKGLTESLCGKSRPTHFAGVTTVVAKLLNVVSPDKIYLGQKDFQQFRVIEKMIEDLELPVQAVMAPIVREEDGLAMSSRNVRLLEPERKQALALTRALQKVKKAVREGEKSAQKLQKILKNEISGSTLGRLDYAEIVDTASLKPMVKLRPGQKVLAAVAVYFGNTRLIDNELIKA